MTKVEIILRDCPACNRLYFLASVLNPRNDKWTAVPLEATDGRGTFDLLTEMHDAVDLAGQTIGPYPVAIYRGTAVDDTEIDPPYQAHSPSHFLDETH